MLIERVSANDATTLATDRGPAPMNIGVVLIVEDGSALSFEAVQALLTARVPLVRRLRQCLLRYPPGCGRPIWVDAADFDIARHVEPIAVERRPVSKDAGTPSHHGAVSAELLSAVATFVCTPLPRDRPLWAARWVTGLGRGEAALVLSAHHCLADGLGGLAVLATLCDEGLPGAAASTPEEPPGAPFPQPAPLSSDVALDAWRARVAGARRLPTRLTQATAGVHELAGARQRPRLAERTSLNRPSGPGRHLTCVSTPVADVIDAAHTRGCTVNDVVLCAVAGAYGGLLRSRGESLSEFVASVPVSDRRTAADGRLGNHTGVMSLTVPLHVDPDERLRRITTITSDRKGPVRGSSSGPLGVAFRALARVGVFQVFIDHQRLVHTFVSNVKGPGVAWHVAGHRVTTVIPMAVTPGNVGVSFDILSYAGQLVVTLVGDPAVVPDQDTLTTLLVGELAHFGARSRSLI